MIEIVNAVNDLAEKEWTDKIDEKGPFVDNHQAYGVIREEIEETADAMESMASCFAKYWKSVKEDEPNASFTDLKDVEFWAKNVAAEAIQVAAMCKKACAYLDGEYYVSIDYEKLDGEKRRNDLSIQ